MTDAATTIHLLRHAKAQSRDRWWGRPDRERPLTKVGWAQSKSLAVDLASRDITRIVTSPFARCVQTVEPLADRLHMEIGLAEALGEAPSVPLLDAGDTWIAPAWLGGRALALIDQVTIDDAGGDILLCSHGDIVSSLMATLAGRDGLDIGDVHLKKGARFELQFKGPKCVSVETVPPP